MKKTVIATLLSLSAVTGFAADYASIDVDHVKGLKGGASSTAQYVRAGKEIGGIQFGVQDRTARFANGTVINSLELTAGKSMGMFQPFVGYGHDNGGTTTKPFNYGLIGVTAGTKVGPGFALAGVKTRVLESNNDPKQTVAFATYSLPVAQKVSLNLNASQSYQTIKERALGLGVTVTF